MLYKYFIINIRSTWQMGSYLGMTSHFTMGWIVMSVILAYKASGVAHCWHQNTRIWEHTPVIQHCIKNIKHHDWQCFIHGERLLTVWVWSHFQSFISRLLESTITLTAKEKLARDPRATLGANGWTVDCVTWQFHRPNYCFTLDSTNYQFHTALSKSHNKHMLVCEINEACWLSFQALTRCLMLIFEYFSMRHQYLVYPSML